MEQEVILKLHRGLGGRAFDLIFGPTFICLAVALGSTPFVVPDFGGADQAVIRAGFGAFAAALAWGGFGLVWGGTAPVGNVRLCRGELRIEVPRLFRTTSVMHRSEISWIAVDRASSRARSVPEGERFLVFGEIPSQQFVRRPLTPRRAFRPAELPTLGTLLETPNVAIAFIEPRRLASGRLMYFLPYGKAIPRTPRKRRAEKGFVLCVQDVEHASAALAEWIRGEER